MIQTIDRPDSSNIDRVIFNDGTLVVRFKSGGEYEYEGVPEKIFDGFRDAESAGKYFWANIRDKYTYRRIR